MTELESSWKQLLQILKNAKESAPGKVTALCPAHNDKNPSLSVTLTDQKIFLQCHAGCSFKTIVRALNLNPNQFTVKKHKLKKRKVEVCRYDYRSEEGECYIRSCDIILRILGPAVQTANTL